MMKVNMVALIFALLVALLAGQSSLAARTRRPTYVAEQFIVDSEQLFNDVFEGTRELGIEGTRKLLQELSQNLKPVDGPVSAIDRLLSVSMEMTSPCDRALLRSVKQMLSIYQNNTINIIPYLQHHHAIINDSCKRYLNQEVTTLIGQLTDQEAQLGHELREIWLSNRDLYDKKGEVTAQWLLNHLDLQQVQQQSDLATQIGILLNSMTRNCAAVRDLFSQNYNLVLIRKLIEPSELDEINPKLQSFFDWPDLCMKADPGFFRAKIIDQVQHRVYEIDSPVWILGSPGRLQEILDEWRSLKQELYSPDSPPLTAKQTLIRLNRLASMKASNLSHGFRRFMNDWDHELLLLIHISKSRCRVDTLGSFHFLEMKHSRSPVILNYIKEYQQAQIDLCVSKFSELLGDALDSTIRTEDNYRALTRIIQLYPEEKTGGLAFTGPQIASTISRYLTGAGLRQIGLQRLQELRALCRELRTRLPPLLELFNYMEREASSSLNTYDATWMQGLKICRGMLDFERDFDELFAKKKRKPSDEGPSDEGPPESDKRLRLAWYIGSVTGDSRTMRMGYAPREGAKQIDCLDRMIQAPGGTSMRRCTQCNEHCFENYHFVTQSSGETARSDPNELI